MKNKWKNLFWTSLLILLFTNLFWFYQTLDSAVGRRYYEVSCSEYEKDKAVFKKLIDSKDTKTELLQFLKDNNISFEGFQKGTDYVVNFNSFSVLFDSKGNLKNE